MTKFYVTIDKNDRLEGIFENYPSASDIGNFRIEKISKEQYDIISNIISNGGNITNFTYTNNILELDEESFLETKKEKRELEKELEKQNAIKEKEEEIKEYYHQAISSYNCNGIRLNSSSDSISTFETLINYAKRNDIDSLMIRDFFNNIIEINVNDLEKNIDEMIERNQKVLADRHKIEQDLKNFNGNIEEIEDFDVVLNSYEPAKEPE